MSAAASVERFGRRITIGEGVTCDLDTLVNTRLLVQANSGAGKSWALRRLLEQTHGHVQQLVIDPEGEFASLRAKFDYVLAARTGGDTVADPRSAKLLAERLLELGVSAILDIYELKPHERVKFVRLFVDALVEAPKHLWHPALVVLDEAHVYCPEQGDAESADAVKGLATRGRKRGFCLVLATQRLSKLHKDAAAECNNKLIGRSSLDVDMKRASDELGFTTKEQRLSLRDLGNGEFFAFGPALSHRVTKVHVGTVQTEHPKAGSHLASVVPPPTEKVRAVLSKLADLPAEAEAREKSIDDLKRDNATLRRQLTEAHKTKVEPMPVPQPTRVEVPVLKDAQIARLEKVYERMLDKADAYGQSMVLLWEQQSEEAKALLAVLRTVTNVPAPPPAEVVSFQTRPPAPRREPPRKAASSGASDSSLGKCERAILRVLACFEDGCVAGKLTLLSGYRYSGGFKNSLATLRVNQYLEGANTGVMRITEAGVSALGDYEPLPQGDELARYWLQHPSFGKCERAILSALLEQPRGMDKDALCEATNYEYSGGFKNSLANLRTAGVLVGRNTEVMRAHEDLFS